MDGEKKWWQSLGVLGPVLTGVSMMLRAFGIDLGIGEADVTQVISTLQSTIQAVVEAVGVLLGIWGRIRATKQITPSVV